ncbi:unnamed protein product [Closterium sp. NIES-54]
MVSEQCLRASLRCPAATRAACLSAVSAARALPACTRDDYCTRAASPRKLPTRARAACPPAPPACERRLPASCLPAHPLPACWRCLPASATCAHALPSCAAKRASPLPARVLPARERPYLHVLLLLLRSPIAAAAAATATTTSTGTTAAAAASLATMATISVLSFEAEGRPISFDVWLDNLQLFLHSTARDGVSLICPDPPSPQLLQPTAPISQSGSHVTLLPALLSAITSR